MRRFTVGTILTATATLLFAASAQNLGETIRGLYGEGLGTSITSHIPGYGTHAVVRLTTTEISPGDARDLASPVFAAIARQIGGTVSVSIFARENFLTHQYELVLQLVDDDFRVFLDGENFNP